MVCSAVLRTFSWIVSHNLLIMPGVKRSVPVLISFFENVFSSVSFYCLNWNCALNSSTLSKSAFVPSLNSSSAFLLSRCLYVPGIYSTYISLGALAWKRRDSHFDTVLEVIFEIKRAFKTDWLTLIFLFIILFLILFLVDSLCLYTVKLFQCFILGQKSCSARYVFGIW